MIRSGAVAWLSLVEAKRFSVWDSEGVEAMRVVHRYLPALSKDAVV